MSVPQLKSEDAVKTFIGKDTLTLVHFSAVWAAQCTQLNDVLADLKADLGDVFDAVMIESEELEKVVSDHKVTAVPTVLFFKSGKELHRVDGYHPADIRTHITRLAANVVEQKQEIESSLPLNDRLQQLITGSRLMLFMKGNPAQPKCGFSRQTVDILNGINAQFKHFDILSDNEVREGLKTYSNWPTYPQLYLDGELIGGLDILREELNDSEFAARIPKKV